MQGKGRNMRCEDLQGHQISSETISAYRNPCRIDFNKIRWLGWLRLFYH
jgi:hypothetical protein